ncbi:MAG: ParB/RepB/Spo0J family partition protein [Thermomicrobiales bacterium]
MDEPSVDGPAGSATVKPAMTRPPTRRGALGRGLESLIPSSDAAALPGATLDVEIGSIRPNPYQPRALMDPEKLEALAASIRIHGVIQPLIVTLAPEPAQYILIAGERRWRASQRAGLATVPVVVKDAASQAMLEIALVENVVRADLSALEEAAAYRQLIDDFGLTQASVAERVGRSRVTVTNTLRLLGAPAEIQAMLPEGRLTEGHARALLGLSTAIDQVALARTTVERGWTVRQTEEAVRRWVAESADGAPVRAGAGARTKSDQHLEERLQRGLATKVSLRREPTGQGGAVTIHYFSDEQLQALIGRILPDDDW